MDFERMVHLAAQKVLPQHANEGYPPLVTVYMRHAPVQVGDDGKPTAPLTLDGRVLDAAQKLGAWADLIAIPSNTPHFFLDQIAEAAQCTIVNMADVTVAEIQRRDTDRVGLIGLGVPKIYSERLGEIGIDPLIASDEGRRKLDDAIIRLMEGKEGDQERSDARATLQEVRDQKAEVTILGCTEIPLLLGDNALADDLVSPAALLAEEVVRRAIAD